MTELSIIIAKYQIPMCIDHNDDNLICPSDLNMILDSLTGGLLKQETKDKVIEHVSQKYY